MSGTADSAVRQEVYFEPELETLELGALRALQLERLKLVVARACERSAVYRELCDAAKV
jgi:phenylacetate-coenzyme A ligase PaaK-like adenylate-forming protein